MCRGVGRRVRGLVVETGSAETPYGTVGHGFTSVGGSLILKVKKGVGLGRSVEGFRVPSYDGQLSSSPMTRVSHQFWTVGQARLRCA